MFAALKNLSDSEDINRVWENIKNISKTLLKRVRSARIEAASTKFRLKMFRFLDQRKQAKLQWVQYPS
jgi:hypothetical protein